jgi:uncharacterized membrane protein
MAKPTELIIATFPTYGGAAGAERTLREADARLESITLGYMAILTRNAEGDVAIDYTTSPELRKRTVFSGIAGTLVAGLLAGPVGLVAGAATTYGAMNALPQIGMDAADVHALARELRRETSALVLLEQLYEKETIIQQLERLGATVSAFTVSEGALAEDEEPTAGDALNVAKERAGDALEATKDALTSAAAAVGRMVGLTSGERPNRAAPAPAPAPEAPSPREPELVAKMEDGRFVVDDDPVPLSMPHLRLPDEAEEGAGKEPGKTFAP